MQESLREYDLIVFDWDGTLMDTTGLIARGIQHAARVMGFSEPSLALARSTIGLDWRHAIAKAVPECPEEAYGTFNKHYRDWYIPHEKEVYLYEGMPELLEELKRNGLLLAIATGKSREGLNRVLSVTGIGALFETTQTASECESKPSADMLERIGIETQVAPERTLMIGDAIFDLVMAERYGCDAVAMTYGAGNKEELSAHSPRCLCEDVRALRRFLQAEAGCLRF